MLNRYMDEWLDRFVNLLVLLSRSTLEFWTGHVLTGGQWLSHMLKDVKDPCSLPTKGQKLPLSHCQLKATLMHFQTPLPCSGGTTLNWDQLYPVLSGCQHSGATVFGWYQKRRQSSMQSRRTDSCCRDEAPFLLGERVSGLGWHKGLHWAPIQRDRAGPSQKQSPYQGYHAMCIEMFCDLSLSYTLHLGKSH